MPDSIPEIHMGVIEFNACYAALCPGYLETMAASAPDVRSCFFRASAAQYASIRILCWYAFEAKEGEAPKEIENVNGFLSKIGLPPIVLDQSIGKSEIQLVNSSGEVLAVMKNLAIPSAYRE